MKKIEFVYGESVPRPLLKGNTVTVQLKATSDIVIGAISIGLEKIPDIKVKDFRVMGIPYIQGTFNWNDSFDAVILGWFAQPNAGIHYKAGDVVLELDYEVKINLHAGYNLKPTAIEAQQYEMGDEQFTSIPQVILQADSFHKAATGEMVAAQNYTKTPVLPICKNCLNRSCRKCIPGGFPIVYGGSCDLVKV